MPHHPEDSRYQHLLLLREEPNPERRRRPAPPSPPPNRGGRTQFAGELREQIDQFEADLAARLASPAGIQPHLVFRVPLTDGASPQTVSDLLERLGISVVAIESDKAIIAFRDDGDLTQFRTAIAAYEQGPQPGINPQTGQPYQGTQWDVLQFIEVPQMRLWSRTDRIGRRLAQEIGDQAQSIVADELYVLDIEMWHRGTDDLARGAIQELRQFIEHQPAQGERLSDSFAGQLLCLARVMVRGSTLDALLNLDIVAEAERPPQPVFDSRVVLRATQRDFPVPPLPLPGGPSLCVVDSGIVSNHPLLARNVGHEEAVMSSTDSVADENGHGTMVGGIAVFGDIRVCFESGGFSSPITLFSARVLNADNRFDDTTLIIHQMRRVIEVFTVPPYNCHVFNLSLGDDCAWQSSKQSLWAESLDTLAREFNVVLVVSAGNHNRGWSNTTQEAEEILESYPSFLFDADCGLCEPATAAIPITVGGISDRDIPAFALGSRSEDFSRTIATEGEPSPTTRIGPGIAGAIKPEFVAPAGNQVFQGVSTIRRVDDDGGCSIMSFSHQPTRQLFAFDNGTSFAAPRVARSAAILWNSIQENLGEEPQANLVRAILASAAHLPAAEHNRIQQARSEDEIRRVYGYGMLDEDVIFDSADRRVTLIAQGTMPLDTLAVFEVPAPAEFRAAAGNKQVTVSLAYDPPVRRRRAEYLGVRMDYALIRGKSLDEIVEAYRQLSQDERIAGRENPDGIQGAFQAPFKCGLEPGPRALQGSTLQQSRWTFTREGSDYGESWYLVIRAQRTWAPDTFTDQRFAVTVTLQANEPQLYNLVRNRIQVRQQQRARTLG